MNIAILLAAGSGTRLGASLPKQFLEVCGKTILEHTVEAFESSDDIDEIAIVTREDYVEKVSELIGEHHPKLKRVLMGGKERYQSSIAAIEAYTNDEDNIMIHDAVRPMVSKRIIRDCVEALKKYDAVDVAVPATDTILQVDENGPSVRYDRRLRSCAPLHARSSDIHRGRREHEYQDYVQRGHKDIRKLSEPLICGSFFCRLSEKYYICSLLCI